MSARDFSLLLTLAAVWGSSFLLMRIATPAFGPFGLVLVRLGLGVLVLVPMLLLRRAPGQFQAHAKPIAIAAFFNSALPFSLLAYSTLKLSAGVTAVLNATTPVIAALLGAAFLNQKLRAAQWSGFALTFLGVTILSSDKFSAVGTEALPAFAASMLAACSYAIGAHYTRAHLRDVPPLISSVGTLGAGTLMLLPCAAMTWPRGTIGAMPWISAALLGVICTGVAYLLYFRLIARIGATRTAAVTVIVPVFAAAWGALILDEPLTTSIVTGAAIVLTGSFLALQPRPPIPATNPEN